jgi:hypothetical protein
MKRQSVSVIIALSLLISLAAPFAWAADRYSVRTDNWNSTSTWSATSGGASGASVPGASDNVYIERGYTVTIAAAPTNGTIASLTIGGTTAGTLDIHPAASGSYTVTVSGDVTINSNGSFTVTNYSGFNYHTINIGGNLTVEGTFNMTTTTDDHASVVFNGGAQQTISGSGATCTFYSLTASNTSSAGLVLNRNVVLAVSGSQTATDLTVTANDIFDLGSYTADRSTTGAGTVTVNAGATLKIGGTGTFPANYNTNTLNATSTVEYYGTTQSVAALTYGNLTLSGSEVKTLAGTTSIAGDLTVSSGTFDLSSYTANRSAAGGTLTVSNGATLKIGGTGTTPSNYSTHSIGSTSTIEYAGTNQSIAILNSSQNYGNLTISGSGTKTLAGSVTVGGTLSVQGTATLALGGSTLTYGASASLEYNGTTAQTTGPELPSSIASGQTVIINNSLGVTLGASKEIDGTLTMTQGTLHLSSYNLTIGSSGSVGASSSSYVVTDGSGVLTRNAVGASDVLFPVGTGSAYNPATINNTGTSDNFSVSLKSSFDHTPNNANYVNCQWTITEAGTGGNATITLQWNATDEHTGFSRANPIYIGRWNGTQWVQTSATLGGSGPYTATASNFTSFSPFGVGNDGALPIQMASFAASVIRDNDVEVTWKTMSETNNYGFEVYRKRDGTDNWLKIAFVNGHGTTLAPQSYSYLDRSVPFGKYYYRIKQIDLDGKSETFPEMEVAIGVAPGAFVLAQNYPNPFNPSTLIEFVVPQNGFATVKVYNMLGQEVATLFEGNAEAGRINTVRFSATGGSAFGGNASNLSSGLYFYTLRSAGKTETKRMVLMK